MSGEPPTEEQPLGEAARLSAVLIEPKKAFTDIVARPRFWVPLLLVSVTALAFTYFVSQRIGWDRIIRDAIEKSPQGKNLSGEEKEKIVRQQSRFAGYAGTAGAAIGPAAVLLLASAVYLLVFGSLLGAEIRYRQVLAVYSYSTLPGVISTLLAILVLHLKPPDEFDMQNPLAFNVAAFLPENTEGWLLALGSSLDLFTFWGLALLIVGMRALAPRLSNGTVIAGVLGPWLLWVTLKTVWAAMFT